MFKNPITIGRRFIFKQSSAIHNIPNHSQLPVQTHHTYYYSKSIHQSSDIIMRSIERDSALPVTQLTFREMFNHTKFVCDSNKSTKKQREQLLMHSAEFVRLQTIPRIARLVSSLKNMPYGVCDTPTIQTVLQAYIDSYKVMSELQPISTMAQEEEFSFLCRHGLLKHAMSMPCIAFGILEKAHEFSDERDGNGAENENVNSFIVQCPYLNDFVDRFASLRLASRVLLGHHITMHDQIFAEDAKITGILHFFCIINIVLFRYFFSNNIRKCFRIFVAYFICAFIFIA